MAALARGHTTTTCRLVRLQQSEAMLLLSMDALFHGNHGS
jgi:hypothetical protein